MNEYLERFAKRMEFIAAADSIVGRTNRKQEIERLFEDGDLDNILLSILVFIMETTLTEEQDCTIGAIIGFLSETLPAYGKYMSSAELEETARYLVKDILQNKGDMRLFPVMDYGGGRRSYPVRLVADKLGHNNQILYELTKQGFDFLFRTKEVDDELGFEIEAIRLKMLISKKNYKKATSQSKYIIAMLLEKRNEIRQFEQQLRNDIFTVSGEQYDAVVRNLDETLKEEFEVMLEIERMLSLAQARLDEESKLYPEAGEKSRDARKEVVHIAENVQRALGMQRELLIQCDGLRRLYLLLLQDSLSFNQVRRFDMEEQVIKRMEALTVSGASGLRALRAGLFAPLFLPGLKKLLNLSLVYDRQARVKESEADESVSEGETVSDSGKRERIRLRNEAHVRVVRLLLDFAKTHPSFLFSEFWEEIKTHRHIAEMTAERLLFLAMLKLYEIREIDFAKWRAEGIHPQECMGEFDLDYCLTLCYGQGGAPTAMERIAVEKTGNHAVCGLGGEEYIIIDDLEFKVRSNETDGEGTEQAAG